MLNTELMTCRMLQCWLAAAAWGSLLLACLTSRADAASTILNTGFEIPYALGPLQGQFGWVTSGGGGSTAIVENSTVYSGSQALQVTKAATAGSDRRWAVPVAGYPSQRYVIVDWDMRVAQASVLTGFGPFFGVEGYDANVLPYVLGSLGVDATTGDVLYQLQDTGVLAGTGALVTFNQWNHFRLVFDFTTDSYRGYLNGSQVASTGFVDRVFGLNDFTDADIATFAAAADPVSQTVGSSAVIDNFVVRDGLLGDYDLDGDVDNGDFTTWRQSFGATVAPIGNNADGNRNGVVDAADYVIWRENRGANLVSGAGQAAVVVPEPGASSIILSVVGAGLVGRRRRRLRWAVG